MENIGGIFVVLICGLIIAVFVAVMEFVWSTRRSAETDEVKPSFCQSSGLPISPDPSVGHTSVSLIHQVTCSFKPTQINFIHPLDCYRCCRRV